MATLSPMPMAVSSDGTAPRAPWKERGLLMPRAHDEPTVRVRVSSLPCAQGALAI